jgi:hypothetical protein
MDLSEKSTDLYSQLKKRDFKGKLNQQAKLKRSHTQVWHLKNGGILARLGIRMRLRDNGED